MFERLNGLDWVSLVLILIGGVNWGLIGFFGFDLVAALFGEFSALTRIIYAVVGVAAVYTIVRSATLYRSEEESPMTTTGGRTM